MYILLTSMLMIVGTESVSTSFVTGVRVILSNCFSAESERLYLFSVRSLSESRDNALLWFSNIIPTP